ncbi:MAG: hypothetical protein RLZZ59_765 [Pseudomonadota bacterium]|jgi:NTE family protein
MRFLDIRLCIIILFSFLLSGCAHVSKKRYYTDDSYSSPIKKNIDIALVLGGGGARAIAHLGVLEVLEENGLKPDLIVGTSGGSIIGSLYSDSPSVTSLKMLLKKIKKEDFVDFSLVAAIRSTHSLSSSLVNGVYGESFLKENMEALEFKDLKIPFIALATDIETGETIAINNGPIAPAVRASYSIPGLFAPVEIYGRTLVDGGVSAPLGIEVARKYNPKVIIAVDLTLPVDKSKVHNLIDVLTKSLSINYASLNNLIAKEADVLIRPKIKTGIGLFDTHRKEELYEAGRLAALGKVSDIKTQLLAKKTLIYKLLRKKKI